MEFLVFTELIIIGLLIWYIKKRNDQEAYEIMQNIEAGVELKKTMAMGLAYRFTSKQSEETKKHSNLFLLQTPYDFEDFTAEIMSKKYGGTSIVTPRSGDFGVDFEHRREEGLYLGQAKAHMTDVDFAPIAKVHSNMVKRGAIGGYIITTADFTPSAKKYAEGLNIELINGVKLVDYWLESMDSAVYEPSGEFA